MNIFLIARKYAANKYTLFFLFVIMFYSVSAFFGIQVKDISPKTTSDALWFYYLMLYMSLPIISFVALYRLIFIEKQGKNLILSQANLSFENIFSSDTNQSVSLESKLLKYEEFLCLRKNYLQEKLNKTEQRGIAFSSTAILFPLFTYILIGSVAFSTNEYPHLSTLTFPNLTIATIAISAGVTLINLSKRIGSEINIIEAEILVIAKMRLVLISSNENELEDINKKIKNQLIKWNNSENTKQDEGVDVPAMLSVMKNLMSQK